MSSSARPRSADEPTPSTSGRDTGSTPAPAGSRASIPPRSRWSTSSACAICSRRCSCAAGDLLLDGSLHATPNSLGRILRTYLLGPIDKLRFIAYMARLFATQRGELAIDLGHDGETAIAALAMAGEAARERIVRPNFEGPFFARLEEMSGAVVRSWLRAPRSGAAAPEARNGEARPPARRRGGKRGGRRPAAGRASPAWGAQP